MEAPPFQLHMAMYPWLAIGHISAYLHLANRLAQRGHRISFFIPKRTKANFEHQNLHPHFITFISITVPHVDGLPPDAENTLDVPFSLHTLLMTAMNLTEKDFEQYLLELKPNIVLFDFAYWLPTLSRRLGIKSVQYHVTSLLSAAYVESVERQCEGNKSLRVELMRSPAGFIDSNIKLHVLEALFAAAMMEQEFGGGIRFYDCLNTGMRLSDAIGFKGCRELEGPYADYLERLYEKPFLLSGPVLPEPSNSTLDEEWAEWLSGFKAGTVIYCAFGSEWKLEQNQFCELLLGLELSGFPFLAALKAPVGFESVEAAMPEGFKERLQGHGVVHGGWVQQTLILDHPSVGCFITHCGSGSLLEALVSKCQMVLLPNILDQVLNARMISNSLKAGVEVEKGEEDGLIKKESVCKAVMTVMDDSSEVAREVRENHNKLRSLLLSKDLESTYIDSFCHKLHELIR